MSFVAAASTAACQPDVGTERHDGAPVRGGGSIVGGAPGGEIRCGHGRLLGLGGADQQPDVVPTNSSAHPGHVGDGAGNLDARHILDLSGHASVAFWNVGGLKRNHVKIFSACDSDVNCLVETFLEDGKEAYLQLPPGFSAIFHPASRNAITGRASGGFCLLYNSRTVKVSSSEFKAISDSIFYGPVVISGQRFFVIMVYRTKNAGSAVYDEIFYDHLHGLLELLRDEFIVLGGDFNAKIGDMTGALSFLDDAGRFIPQQSTTQERIWSQCYRVTTFSTSSTPRADRYAILSGISAG